MKKFIKLLTSLLFITLFLNQIHVYSEQTQNEENSSKVVIDKDANFKTMNSTEKDKLYQSLDQISTSPELSKEEKQFSSVVEMKGDKAFDELLEASKKESQILYVGFDDCPYCRAFIPKFNHMAQSYKMTIHYYNVTEHSSDENYSKIISEFLKIDDVPHAFIVKDGKLLSEKLDSNSTMAEMEAFISSLEK